MSERPYQPALHPLVMKTTEPPERSATFQIVVLIYRQINTLLIHPCCLSTRGCRIVSDKWYSLGAHQGCDHQPPPCLKNSLNFTQTCWVIHCNKTYPPPCLNLSETNNSFECNLKFDVFRCDGSCQCAYLRHVINDSTQQETRWL